MKGLILTAFIGFFSASIYAFPPASWPAPSTELITVEAKTESVESADRPPAEQLAQVQDYLQQYRREGNPRRLGEASGVLAKLEPPTTLSPLLKWRFHFLTAQIAESLHKFDEAQRGLESAWQVLSNAGEAEVGDPYEQTLLALMNLAVVRGEYNAATSHCEQLGVVSPSLYSQACREYLRGLNSDIEQAFEALQGLVRAKMLQGTGPELHWSLVSLADLADRGRRADALSLWRSAAALSPGDQYVRDRFCLAALQQREYALVLDISEGALSDGVLTCRAVALKSLAATNAVDHKKQYLQLKEELLEKFEGAQWRGERLHKRAYAHFLLDVVDKPQLALRVASSNWQEQREWPDEQLLARSRSAEGAQQ